MIYCLSIDRLHIFFPMTKLFEYNTFRLFKLTLNPLPYLEMSCDLSDSGTLDCEFEDPNLFQKIVLCKSPLFTVLSRKFGFIFQGIIFLVNPDTIPVLFSHNIYIYIK